MHLQSLSIQGFKSFARHVQLEFPLAGATKGVAAIVGPNGSGKSNIADAIRWVLGEQSVKLLRGKKSADVIFAGSESKGKLGMAEVTLYLDNTDGTADVDMSEIALTRRLYRSGESDYLINNKKARLQDVAILLARAHFGQRTYSVIGQGMIDHFLVASPAERKEFFDEATGVKEFQIKRHQAVLKLTRTEENLYETEMLMSEIEPHLRSLKRQVSKLEKREEIEKELLDVQRQFYGVLWHDLTRQHKTLQKQYFEIEGKRNDAQRQYDEVKKLLRELEQKETTSEGLLELQRAYQKHAEAVQEKRLALNKLQSALEIAKVRKEVAWEAIPLSKIIESVKGLAAKHEQALVALRALTDLKELPRLLKAFEDAHASVQTLLKGLQRPAPEKNNSAPDPSLANSMEENKKTLVLLEEEMRQVARAMEEQSSQEKKNKTQFFQLQHTFQERQETLRGLDEQLGSLRVELAKIDTRREGLEQEMARELVEYVVDVKNGTFSGTAESVEPLREKLYDLKNKLELIGGIDPEVLEEYDAVRQRYEFLETHVADLKKAVDDLYKILNELDNQTKARRDEALKEINKQFVHFFKVLFGGGKAELKPFFSDEVEDNLDEEEEEGAEAEQEKELLAPAPLGPEKKQHRVSTVRVLAGVDITAVPPGKKIINLNSLSGGERAMTSIALICAIIAVNPSPFVVLDEVDAALDEANSIRFAKILEELSHYTQFICITHNRASMNVAHLLYGVTMGTDGVSSLLSVKLEEAQAQAAR